MDDIVLRGMAKWPNVPAVYGWVSLDRRGNWRLKGERISNANVIAFIGRNYERDQEGRWFFQNGPQRVFVTLDYTPFVYRIISDAGAPLTIEDHRGQRAASASGSWMDEAGTLLLQTEIGIGIVNDLDLDRVFPYMVDAEGCPPDDNELGGLMELLQEQHRVPLWLKIHELNLKIEPIKAGDVAQHFGFVARPAEPSGRERCV